MADDSSVLRNLFGGAFPDEWRSNPEFSQYLSELHAFSLDRLSEFVDEQHQTTADEPERLSEETSRLLGATRQLAFDNYKAFIQTADCTKDIFKDFLSVENHVNGLLDKVPRFVDSCRNFQSKAEDISQRRKRTSLMLSKHTQLLELLEIPQVMDTCVRSGYHDEALELSAFVRRLDKKHGDIPIIKHIAKDVARCLQLMLTQLIQQLKSNIQLPTCLRAVGYLRRMDVFSEAELRLRFLQARDSWLKGVLGGIPQDDAYQHIMKTIELSRVHLFDIITQYKAVFPDEDASLLSTSKKDRSRPAEGGVFHAWLNQKIWDFLHTLEVDLSAGVGGRLDSVLSQCMYFGLSFSRIGADFRPILLPIVHRSVLESFKKTIRRATVEFATSMKKFTLLSMPGATMTTPYIKPLPQSSAAASVQSPPLALLEYPPLAVFANALVTCFNDLRLCLPLSVALVVVEEVRAAICSIVGNMTEFYRFEGKSFSEKESTLFNHCCQVLYRSFCPWVRSCLATLFPSTAVNFLASCSPFAIHCTRGEGWGVGRSKTVHVDLSLNPDDLVKELRELIPEAFKTEEGNAEKELSSSVTPSSSLLLGSSAAQLGAVTLHPALTSTPGPAAELTQTSNHPPLPDQGEPPVASAGSLPFPLKNTEEQQTTSDEVTAPSLHGDSDQPPSNSAAKGTKED